MFKFILSFTVTLLVLQDAAGNPASSLQNRRDYEFEFFTVSMMWPQTACWNLNKKWSDINKGCSSCQMPADRASWTLHGLWPSNQRIDESPSSCTGYGVSYDKNLIDGDLRRQMEAKWATYSLRSSNDVFWAHEFNKHGTCALPIPETNSMVKYFRKSLELVQQHNLGPALAAGGVTPGGKHKFRGLYQGLKNHFGVNVYVQCAKNANSQYLYQINVCLDKTFRLIDCNDGRRSSNCDWNLDIEYPRMLEKCRD